MLTCATLLFVGDAYWGGHPLLFIWHALFSISLVPVLLACAWAAPSAMAMLANRPMRHLGDISFGVYLWHMPVESWRCLHCCRNGRRWRDSGRCSDWCFR